MNTEQRVRDACAELRKATDNRPLPTARFVASAIGRKRRARQLALAVAVSLSVAALVVRAVDGDGKLNQIDTVVSSSTTAPTDSESPPNFSPPPAKLPYYVGMPLSELPAVLERWGVDTELVVEPGVSVPSHGRIIGQEPSGGTPLIAGMTVTFRIGLPTAMLDGEFEIGSGSSGRNGSWRVIVSTRVSFTDPSSGDPEYTVLFLSDESCAIGTARLDSNAVVAYDHADLLGLVAGTAPASAVEVQLLDFKGDVVSSVATKQSSDPRFATVSFWLIETANHPFYSSLRAVDRDGSIVALRPGR